MSDSDPFSWEVQNKAFKPKINPHPVYNNFIVELVWFLGKYAAILYVIIITILWLCGFPIIKS